MVFSTFGFLSASTQDECQAFYQLNIYIYLDIYKYILYIYVYKYILYVYVCKYILYIYVSKYILYIICI